MVLKVPRISSAMFSDDRRYRYELHRRWRSGYRDQVCFVMLNPSTADEVDNDPTIERCERRAMSWQFRNLAVANIFALRSTDPNALLKDANPVGDDNDRAIIGVAKESEMVICAWGNHKAAKARGPVVLKLLRENGIKPYALKINKDGSPAHPLYLPYELQPVEMP